jgi:GNAT superfamily N-acetyltransferase
MQPSARPATLQDILPLRALYRQEMNCQIIHDSIHSRQGWSNEFLLRLGDTPVGYGSLAIAGPWKDKPTLYEFYLLPQFRNRTFDLFEALLAAARPVMIETQSNDPHLTTMLHAYAKNVETESILFHDTLTTHLPSGGATFRPVTPQDPPKIAAADLDTGATFLLELDRRIAATGGILFHYNRPYGDLFMSVAPPLRRRGLGAYLVQELKRTAREAGHTPAARCNPDNVPSRKTLQKAGFVPCGHILHGDLSPEPARTSGA